MSIRVKRGVRWFRPMEVELTVVLTSSEQEDAFVGMLRDQGFEDDAKALAAAIEKEQNDIKAHRTLGYICDPDEQYKAGYLR